MGKQHKSYCRSWIDIGDTRVFCVLEAGHDEPHVSRDWSVDTRRRITERVHMREVRWWYASTPPTDTIVIVPQTETPLLEDSSADEEGHA